MLNQRIITVLFATTILLVGGATPLRGAELETPDATIEFSGEGIAAGLGFIWGHGVLHFQGKDYPFTANGIDIVNVGFTSVNASGRVYNLTKVEDFPGNFRGAVAGATIGGGAEGFTMQNDHGVVIHAESTTSGLSFKLAPSGVTVAFAKGRGTRAQRGN